MRMMLLAAILLGLCERGVLAQDGIVEVIPTSRAKPVAWRYTFEPPGDTWAVPSFDDHDWREGRGAFGSDGTPGLRANTRWITSDIWLRREVTLPASGPDPSKLQLLAFHDEDVEIYIDGVLAARASGFVTDYVPIDVSPAARERLKPGAKLVLAVHCRQTTGGQGVDVGLADVPSDLAARRRKDEYRRFAMSHTGDATSGRRLFADARVACTRCHSDDGKGQQAGPDLSTIGDKFPRAELIDAVLNPSGNIALGNSITVLATRSGEVITGVLKEATEEQLGVMGADGKLQTVRTADVRTRRTARESMMPEGLEAGLSPQEFTDLVEYLVSRRLPEVADAGRQGMPAAIPELRKPVRLTPIHSDEDRFQHPCWFGQIPGERDAFLVCEHETGRIYRLTTTPAGGAGTKALWGDFRGEVRPGGATGLLGLAFHPRFRENRKYYIQHQLVISGQIHSRVSEKIASADLTRDSDRPSRTIFDVVCSTDVHSGGGIEFGPDGMLYIGMGDTGPQGDPGGHGQNLGTPLGKMLRIDVDHEPSPSGAAYAIPPDNPFRDRAGARPEIWAYGFREPWRFSFDRATGDLWVGDVGQDRIEEVDLVRRGENYGWNVYEGFDLFSSRYRAEGMTGTPPVFAYNRRLGNSVTGGYVYRHAGSPFDGVYVCGDFTSRRVWGIRQSGRKLTDIRQLCLAPQPIASFGRDESGALYVVGYDGTIYRLDFSNAAWEASR
jgi:putative heme-binding domain-containing protein